MATDTNIGAFITDPAVRKGVYGSFVVAGILLGATQVGYAAIEGAGQPTWLTVALAVYAFLSVPLGSLALSNTPSNATPTGE